MENFEEQIEELLKKRNDSEQAISNLEDQMRKIESQRVGHIEEVSNLDNEIAELEQLKAEKEKQKELYDKVLEAEKAAEEQNNAKREEAEKLNKVREAQREKAEELNKAAEMQPGSYPIVNKDDYDKMANEHNEELNKIKSEIDRKKAEQLEAERKETERKELVQFKANYPKMIADYNKRLNIYNNEVNKLYELQKQYEQGQIEYSTYESFAIPLAQKYAPLEKEYKQLDETYNKLFKARSPFEGLTDIQLSERLNKINSKSQEKWNMNNTKGINLAETAELTNEIVAIKEEQVRRKNVAVARATSDEELSIDIGQLESALKSGAYDQNPEKLEQIKSTLSLLHNEQDERIARPLLKVSDEQLYAKLDELNEEYIEEWNYSAHMSNGMEDNSARLDVIKKKIEAVEAEKEARLRGRANLDKPEAPSKAMFILERTNPEPENNKPKNEETQEQKNNTPEKSAPETVNPGAPISDNTKNNETIPQNGTPDNPETLENNGKKAEDPYAGRPHITEEEAQRKQEEYYNTNLSQPESKWYQKLGSKIKGFFSRNTTKKLTPAGLNEETSNPASGATGNPQENSFINRLQNYTQDNSSNQQVQDNSSNQQVQNNSNRNQEPQGR